jgi:glycine hydroxymethyltransferase
MRQIAAWIDEVARSPQDEGLLRRISGAVRELCATFPAPGPLE